MCPVFFCFSLYLESMCHGTAGNYEIVRACVGDGHRNFAAGRHWGDVTSGKNNARIYVGARWDLLWIFKRITSRIAEYIKL